MTPAQTSDLRAAVLEIEAQRGEDLEPAIKRLAETASGYFKAAEDENGWDSKKVEISMHGVFAQGDTVLEAAQNWRLAALRCLNPGDRP